MVAHGIAIPPPPRTDQAGLMSEGRTRLQMILLACGVAAPLLYLAMVALVPMRWEGYSSTSQTISELSAIGAPTRSLWVPLGLIYTLLVAAFGWGIWASAGENRRLRVVGALFVAAGVIGLFWPPMHLRGTEFTLTDRLHIVWMAVSGLLTLLAMAFGAAALGKRFRVYCIASMVALLATSAMTSMAAPNVAPNLPTPWIGVSERISVVVWMLWLLVLAVVLLRRNAKATPAAGRVPRPGGAA